MKRLAILLFPLLFVSCSNNEQKEEVNTEPLNLEPYKPDYLKGYTTEEGVTYHRDNIFAPHSREEEREMKKRQRNREYDPFEEAEKRGYKKGYEDARNEYGN